MFLQVISLFESVTSRLVYRGHYNSAHRLNFMDLVVLYFEYVRPMTRARLKIPIHCVEPRNAYDCDRVLLLRPPENGQAKHEPGFGVRDVEFRW